MISTVEFASTARKEKNQAIAKATSRRACYEGGLSHSGTVKANSSPMARAPGRAVARPEFFLLIPRSPLGVEGCCVARSCP